MLAEVYHAQAQIKNGLRRSLRSPPSIALGLWTNPSATEPGPEGFRTLSDPRLGEKIPRGRQYLLGYPGLSGFGRPTARLRGRFGSQDSTCCQRGKPAF